ncbi:carbohydrate ABC transporter permease [Alicyclobacillus sp. ALC3]|uniref:carbohydrate ABC transporter permease n=1 Tax=Alicyclobacillus sp. ALC3 TaxID=2796143 RepID=UPI002378BB26|nr:carbohydrate ABC transporter permease [Alicyclobacillus sp. ALC3]WDL98381.1 carbohydrate ABC transporter permease [Alicyclobacillus sp. ALC3]
MQSAVAGESQRSGSRIKWSRVGVYALVIIVLLWTLAPLYFLVITSFKTLIGTTTYPISWIPHPFTLQNYAIMFSHYSQDSVSFRFLHALRNSVIAAGVTTLLNLVLGTAAAYVLSRARIRGKNIITMSFLASNLVPAIALVIPFYVLTVTYMGSLHLYDTNTVLIIVYTSFSLGLVIWIMRAYFDSIPQDLEEAGMVDGASRIRTLLQILLPLTAPGLLATGLLTFLTSWDNFVLPLTLAPNSSAYNLPFFIYSLNGQYLHMNNEIAAGGILTAIPPVLILILFGKYIVSGLTAGSVKG